MKQQLLLYLDIRINRFGGIVKIQKFNNWFVQLQCVQLRSNRLQHTTGGQTAWITLALVLYPLNSTAELFRRQATVAYLLLAIKTFETFDYSSSS